MKEKLLTLSLVATLFLVGCSHDVVSNNGNDSQTSNTTQNGSNKKLEKLYILSINDLHGHILKDNQGRNGLSSLSYMINNYRNLNEADDVILIANGDMFQGQAVSNLTYGKSVVNVMNHMDFNMMGIGNHEFDWGLEKVLSYWDGDDSNGEANFPLVNSNVYDNSNNLVTKEGKVVQYTIVQKENLKVGICSAIDPEQESSILKTRIENYNFHNTVSSISDAAKILRNKEKCDIVIANIHDGVAGNNVYESYNNKIIAALKNDNKIDVLINGHTHYKNDGLISRNGEISLPVVQAGSSGQALGIITLSINENKEVVGAKAETKYTDTSFDKDIEKIVQEEYGKIKDQVEKVYGVAGETVSSKSSLYKWAASCMQKATDADIAFSNNGGIRGTGNIIKNKNITIENLYDINPFDNEVLLTTKTGSQIKSLMTSYGDSNYYGTKNNMTYSSFIDNQTYKVAVIDYVGFKNYFSLGTNYTNTHLIYRDLMKLDIEKRTELNKQFKPISESTSLLTCLINA